MSNDTSRIEIITVRGCRRRYSGEHKLQLVEETMQPSMTVSVVARLHGVSPSPAVQVEAVDFRRCADAYARLLVKARTPRQPCSL